MISTKDAERVESWIKGAVNGGAHLVTGGSRTGALLAPAIVADAKPEMKISWEELPGPAVAVTALDTIEEGIALVNDSKYGLGAGIFTRDIGNAFRFAREVQTGTVQINWTPLWRADFMPYGGLKGAGLGEKARDMQSK